MSSVQKRSELIKEDILTTALEIFSTKGYVGTNLQDIADQLGTTRTPVYYHFENKLVLYQQTTDRYFQQKNDLYKKTFQNGSNIFEKIRTHLLVSTKRSVLEQTLFMGIENIAELDTVVKNREKCYRFIYSVKEKATKRAVSKGELRQDTDIIEFVNHMYMLHYGFLGMATSQYHNLSEEDIEKLIDTMVQGMIIKYSNTISFGSA